MIAKSFERIHRSNLVGMGIIPLCFKAGEDADTLGLTGHEHFTIDLPSKASDIKPEQDVAVQQIMANPSRVKSNLTHRYTSLLSDCFLECGLSLKDYFYSISVYIMHLIFVVVPLAL